jgi:carboxyl-terminal processing protease
MVRTREFIKRIVILGTIVLLSLIAVERAFSVVRPARPFEEVWRTIDRNFFDPRFNGVNWSAMEREYEPIAGKARSREEFASIVNDMLARLNTSHTRLYIPEDPRYYQLLAIFASRDEELQKELKQWFPDGKIQYTGIGVFTDEIDGKTFVSGVLDGSPAESAGVVTGDRLVAVDGQPYRAIESFRGEAGKTLTLIVERSEGKQETLTVTPKVFDASTMFEDAARRSVTTIERGGKTIGYIHIWSYAGEQYERLLEDELLYGRLRNADALVLDLRGGWGGAPITATNIFTANPVSIDSVPRDGRKYITRSAWAKPVVLLVNEGSRSSKEIIAHVFQSRKIGTVVGTRTPGAVVGGRAFLLSDGSLLYVAVVDVFVDGNIRLEGKGVTPDIEVPFSLPYSRGADPQKKQAIEEAIRSIGS